MSNEVLLHIGISMTQRHRGKSVLLHCTILKMVQPNMLLHEKASEKYVRLTVPPCDKGFYTKTKKLFQYIEGPLCEGLGKTINHL